MADKLTTIYSPRYGKFNRGGWSEHGHRTVEEMVAAIRSHADRLRAEAAAIDAAADQDFHVYQHTGHHVQRNRVVLQEGRE